MRAADGFIQNNMAEKASKSKLIPDLSVKGRRKLTCSMLYRFKARGCSFI